MKREHILITAFVMFLAGLPLVSVGSVNGSPLLWGGGGLLMLAGGTLSIFVHYVHGDTCDSHPVKEG